MRRVAYRIGVRPKPNTVLHCPSLHYEADIRDMEKAFKRVDRQADTCDRMRFCISCGAKLRFLVSDTMDCPRKCGQFYPDRDAVGSPIIIFQSFSDGGRT